jgi:hypothetical protein
MVVSAIATVVALTLIVHNNATSPDVVTQLPSNHWLTSVNRQLQPLAPTLNVFYILMELGLILIATMLSIGFWSGRLGQSWQIVAQALICFYIANLYFGYTTRTSGHLTTDLMEIFWMAGILQLGIAAAVEWEKSSGVKRLLR